MRAGPLTLLSLLFACGEGGGVPAPTIETHVEDWRDEVIYQVVVDRFENGDPSNDVLDGIGPDPGDLVRHQGGDWEGLRQRLGYIEALGATAIWISPIVANVDRTPREDGYHGYWASDFTRLNPRFGDLDDLRRLVRDAHARDLLVIVDVVTNHTGRVFAYDLDADGEGDPGELEPPYRAEGYDAPLLWTHRPRLFAPGGGSFQLEAEHFHRRGFGDVGVREEKFFGDFPTGLRDLATGREDVLEALVETYVRWVRETDVDGFRIDAVPHVEDGFWPAFGRRLRSRLAALGKRRFLLLGEVFTTDSVRLAQLTGETHALDAAFDFPFKFGVVDGMILDGDPPAEVVPVLEGNRELFRPFEQPGGIGLSPWEARVLIADNHDTWRLRGELDRFDSAALALLMVVTVDGIPAIYYGTEQELTGQGGGGSRERMWDTGFRTDTETHRWLRRLLRLRREHAALRQGALRVRYAAETNRESEAPDAGLLAYERDFEGDRVLVVLNANALRAATARVPSGFPVGVELRDELHDQEARWAVGAGGAVEVELGPREAVMLVPAP